MKLKENKGMSLIVFTIIIVILLVVAIGVIIYLLNNPVKENVLTQNPTSIQSSMNSNENKIINENNVTNKDEQKEDIIVEKIYNDSENGEYVITYTKKDKNNNIIWTYKTEKGMETEYELLGTLKITNDRIYINENGTIVVLNKENGKVIWKNAECRKLTSGAFDAVFFDEKQNIYLYRKTLTIIDNSGNTKAILDTTNYEYINGDSVDYKFISNSHLIITIINSEGEENSFHVDLNDYGIVTGVTKNHGVSYIYTKKDKNNKVVWTYETKEHALTELERIEFLTIIEDKIYINEGGTIIALDNATGKIIWKNSEYKGASSCFCIDDENKLYIAGYYGPFLFIIDKNGKTIKKIDSFGDKYIWPSRFELRNNNELIITCTIENEDGEALVVDLKDYSTKIENTKK